MNLEEILTLLGEDNREQALEKIQAIDEEMTFEEPLAAAKLLEELGMKAAHAGAREEASKCLRMAGKIYSDRYDEENNPLYLLKMYRQEIDLQRISDTAGDMLKWRALENGIKVVKEQNPEMDAGTAAYGDALLGEAYLLEGKICLAGRMQEAALDEFMLASELLKGAAQAMAEQESDDLLDAKEETRQMYVQLADCYSLIGDILYNSSSPYAEEALQSALKAAEIAGEEYGCEKESILLSRGMAASRMALCYMDQKRDQEAVEYIERAIADRKQAIELFEDPSLYNELCLACYTATSVYEKCRNEEKVKEYGALGLEMYDKAKEAGLLLPDDSIYFDLKRCAEGKKKGLFARLFG